MFGNELKSGYILLLYNMKYLFQKLIADIFYISLITFIVYFMLELIKSGVVSNYFDLNLLLIWIIGFGILAIIMKKYDRRSQN